jgi:hypothetical protein
MIFLPLTIPAKMLVKVVATVKKKVSRELLSFSPFCVQIVTLLWDLERERERVHT